ncbi:hypothetical protein Tco_1174986 [Tanacetum coccineum]
MQAARDRQKSYADKRRRPLKFEVGDKKGLVQQLTLLELPQELSRVHNVFHVCNLKKCLSDDTLVIPLEEIQLDDKLNFVEEPVEIMDREVKQLKRSRIPIVKVRWNARRGPEYTWEREDQFKSKYPHLFDLRRLTVKYNYSLLIGLSPELTQVAICPIYHEPLILVSANVMDRSIGSDIPVCLGLTLVKQTQFHLSQTTGVPG